MNKQQLIEVLAGKTNTTKKEAGDFLNAFIETVGETLKDGDKIQLVGFGSFETKERAARVGRNPKNPQEEIQIPAKISPVFKAGKCLKDMVK